MRPIQARKPYLPICLCAAALAFARVTPPLAAQEPLSDPRLIAVRIEPERPGFGVPFELTVSLRIGAGIGLVLPEVLGRSEVVEGTRPGSWRTNTAPGDSVDVTAIYPAIAFSGGQHPLPPISIAVQPLTSADSIVLMAAADFVVGERPEMREWLLRPGAVEVAPHPVMEENGAVLAPRPAADVIGREWSVWLLLAIGFASAAGVGGARVLVPRWWAGWGSNLFARMRGRSPRQDALKELEWIRSTGWHRNGRVDDFYASSTDTIRRYAERVDIACAPALTSNELLEAIRSRWGSNAAAPLANVVEVAERVKFGTLRPDPETAERDWAALRDWVARGPGLG